MKCMNCGCEVDNSNGFCPSCGFKMMSNDTANQQVPNTGYGNQTYPNQDYNNFNPNNGYMNQDFNNINYNQGYNAGVPNQGYPNNVYPNQGYDNAGYNQNYNNGYNNQPYTQNPNGGYPAQGYDNQAYTNQGYNPNFNNQGYNNFNNGYNNQPYNNMNPAKKSIKIPKKVLIPVVSVIGAVLVLVLLYSFVLKPTLNKNEAKKATQTSVDMFLNMDMDLCMDEIKAIPASAYSAVYNAALDCIEEIDPDEYEDIVEYIEDDFGIENGKDIKKMVDAAIPMLQSELEGDDFKESQENWKEALGDIDIKVGKATKIDSAKDIQNSLVDSIDNALTEISKSPEIDEDYLEEIEDIRDDIDDTIDELEDYDEYEYVMDAIDDVIAKSEGTYLVDITVSYEGMNFTFQDIVFKFDGEYISVIGPTATAAVGPALIRYLDKSKMSNDISSARTITTAIQTSLGNERVYELLTSGSDGYTYIYLTPGSENGSGIKIVNNTTTENQQAAIDEISATLGNKVPTIKCTDIDGDAGNPSCWVAVVTSSGSVYVYASSVDSGFDFNYAEDYGYELYPETCREYR